MKEELVKKLAKMGYILLDTKHSPTGVTFPYMVLKPADSSGANNAIYFSSLESINDFIEPKDNLTDEVGKEGE